MKVKYFNFKKDQFWDGDEAIIDYIMDILGIDTHNNWKVKRDTTITIIVNYDKKQKVIQKLKEVKSK